MVTLEMMGINKGANSVVALTNDDAINLYFKSILSKPVYFEFTENLEPELNELYQQFHNKKK